MTLPLLLKDTKGHPMGTTEVMYFKNGVYVPAAIVQVDRRHRRQAILNRDLRHDNN